MANPTKMTRLLRLKEKDWKLRIAKGAKLERELKDVLSHERHLVSLLDSDGLTTALFAELTLNKLQLTALRKQELARALERQLAAAREAGKGVKMLENLITRATEAAAQEAAQEELRAVIDLTVHPAWVRLP